MLNDYSDFFLLILPTLSEIGMIIIPILPWRIWGSERLTHSQSHTFRIELSVKPEGIPKWGKATNNGEICIILSMNSVVLS